MSEILDLRKAFTIKTIIESICDWNAARYDQVLSTNLTVDLLSEEDRETALAVANNDPVEICDGLADIFYVAVGGMWKHGLNHEEITEALDWASQSPTTTSTCKYCMVLYRARTCCISSNRFACI